MLTEALQHKLRSTPGCQVSAFLLVPGCVNTSDCPRFELGTHRPAGPLIPCATRALSVIRTRGDKWIEGADFKPDRAKVRV